MFKKLIKNSQPFGKNVRKPQGGIFVDSHCRMGLIHYLASLRFHLLWFAVNCTADVVNAEMLRVARQL